MAGLTRLKIAVLAPFVLFVVLLGLGMSVAQYLSHQRESRRAVVQTANAITASLRNAIESETAMMAGMLDILAGRTDLVDAFRTGDIARLQQLTGDTFARMKREQGITHFYFSDIRRVNRLRVHQPQRAGDVVNRPSTLAAERTEALAHGIELGPLGTLTLRVVLPWRVDGQVIGYLELGKEIDALFDNLRRQFGLQPLVFLPKARLDRAGWEDGMRMLGRTPDWDLLPDRVIAIRGDQPVDQLLALRAHPGREMHTDGQWLIWLQLPLADLARDADFDVGAVLDVTSRRQEVRNFVWLVVQVVLVGSALIVTLFWFLLDRIEERLGRSELRERNLGRILNLLRDKIHIFETPALRLVGGNAMALAQAGGPDAIGRASFDTVFADMERSQVQALDSASQTLTQEGHALDAQGQTTAVETRFTYVGDNGDAGPVVVAVSADISERKRRESQLRTLWLALDQSPVSVMITDSHARIEYVNPAFTRLTGYAPEDVLGRSPRLLQSGRTDPVTYHELWTSLRQGQAWSGELINRRKNGEIYVDHSLISPVRDDALRIVNFLAVKEDITAREERQRALADMAEALRRSNAELEQFAYVTSHDLRQPLRQVVSYLSLIQRRLPRLEGDLATFFDFAVSGAKRMDALILALLDYSRAGGTGQGENVDMGELIGECLRQDHLLIAESGADIQVENGGTAIIGGARLQLQRLIDNLIGNALKYRRDGVAAQVTLGWRRQDGDWLFWVADNGIGMAEDQCERAFGMFQRLADPDLFEGTGIGLAICRKIVEHHGGRIWCQAQPDQGCTFWFTLPAAQSNAPAATAAH